MEQLLKNGVFLSETLTQQPVKIFPYDLTNKEASTVFCYVVKHAGSDRAQKKCKGTTRDALECFPHFLSALPLPKCFTTEQSTVEASLFVL